MICLFYCTLLCYVLDRSNIHDIAMVGVSSTLQIEQHKNIMNKLIRYIFMDVSPQSQKIRPQTHAPTHPLDTPSPPRQEAY